MLIVYIFGGLLLFLILSILIFYLIIYFYLRKEFMKVCLNYGFSMEETKKLWKYSKDTIIDNFLKEMSKK